MSAPVDRVAMRVVTFLGSAGIIGLLGVIGLVYSATSFETIDPSTVALVAGVSTIVGALFGSLGSILASTGKGSPQPVTVENAPSSPLPVVESPQSPYSVGSNDL